MSEEESGTVEKAENPFIGCGCMVIILIFVMIVYFCSKSGPDCWECAYKRAYCQTLVDLGKGTGSCEELVVPESCWKKEYAITQKGWDRGVKDAKDLK